MPSRMSCCIPSEVRPARKVWMLSIDRSTRVSSPRRSRRSSQLGEQAEGDEPAQDEERHDAEPERGDGRVTDGQDVLRPDPTVRAAPEDAEHDEGQAERGQRGSDEVELRDALRLGARLQPAAQQEDDDDGHDLAGEDQPPGPGRRDEPADDRPDGDGCGGHPTDDPVGEGAVLAFVVGGDEGGDGRDDHDGAEALDERPAQEQGRQVGAEGGGQGPGPVDGQADGERSLAAPDVADLGAHEHERGHDQGVGGDGQLDALDGRVEVLDDLRDRHVHDAAVEDHHELGGGQDGDGGPAAHHGRSFFLDRRVRPVVVAGPSDARSRARS